MLTQDELWEKCGQNVAITAEDIGLPEWRNHTDGFVYECGGYTIYKTPDGYRHCDGKFVSNFEKWWFGLK